MAKQLQVRITSPEKVIWEGQAKSVSSVNLDGPFDILPEHANFISIVEKNPLIVRVGREKKEFDLEKYVVYVHDNQVFVYTTV